MSVNQDENDQYDSKCPDCDIVCDINVPIACLINLSTQEDKMVCQDCWDCFKNEYKQEGFFNTDTECEDDHGVKVIYNIETGGWEAIEDHCVECGYPECECVEDLPRDCEECKEDFLPSKEHKFDSVCDSCVSECGKIQTLYTESQYLIATKFKKSKEGSAC